MIISSITDLEMYIAHIGVSKWKFGGTANLKDLTEYVYDKFWCGINIEPQFNNLLCDYLESCGENINDYSLRRNS